MTSQRQNPALPHTTLTEPANADRSTTRPTAAQEHPFQPMSTLGTHQIAERTVLESTVYLRRTSMVARPKILRPADFAVRTTVAVLVSGSIDLIRPVNSTSPAETAPTTV